SNAAGDRHTRRCGRALPVVRGVHPANAQWAAGNAQGLHPSAAAAAGPSIGPATTASRRVRRFVNLLPSADLEDLRPADGTGAFGRRSAIFHGDLLGVLDLALGLALHAVAICHGSLLHLVELV